MEEEEEEFEDLGPESEITRGIDRAVFGVCELLGLLFGLPFGDDLYHDTPVKGVHVAYLVVGIIFAAIGPSWPIMRRSFPQNRLVLSLGRAASDSRVWIAILLIAFVYGIAPDVYRRAISPVVVHAPFPDPPAELMKPPPSLAVISAPRPTQDPSDTAEIKRLNGEIVSLSQRLDAKRMWHPFSPSCVTGIIKSLDDVERAKGIPRSLVVITAPDSNKQILDDLADVISTASGKTPFEWIDAPSRKVISDAPVLSADGPVGITVHGKNPAADFLKTTLLSFFTIHQTGDMPEAALQDYYRRDERGSQLLDPNGYIVWLEIGLGDPRNSGCLGSP